MQATGQPLTVPAPELRPGDNIRISHDTGVRAHRVTRDGDTITVWGQAEPRDPDATERQIGTYAATSTVRLHGRDAPALTP